MQPKIIDAFPFFNELDLLELRLQELNGVVDKFVIAECRQTYGGKQKPLYLRENWGRFSQFHNKIVHVVLDKLEPPLKHTLQQYVPNVPAQDIRTVGRQREAFARDAILPHILKLDPKPEDILSFGDCDEIPRATALKLFVEGFFGHAARLKQNTYYYNVNTMIDYGRDVCSRARVGRFSEVTKAGSLYNFRMLGNKQANFPAIENAGWHFSYFGGDIRKLHEKVDAMNPFLQEYKLYGDAELIRDIVGRKDLHRRPIGFSELPETFEFRRADDPILPQYFIQNLKKFEHFTLDYFKRKHGR